MTLSTSSFSSVPERIERRSVKRGFRQALVTRWKLLTHSNYFVQCPCPYCGGMVSVRECMVKGETHWFCTEESREEYQSTHLPLG